MSARKQLPPCIVTRGGVPQKLVPVLSPRIRSGILLPVEPGEAGVMFANRQCAERAILRTQAAAGELKGTLLEGWPKLAILSEPTPFVVVQIIPVTKGAAS